MMLAYQPVKTLTKVNVAISEGLSASERILPIIDLKNEINPNLNSSNLNLNNGDIVFNNVHFFYKSNPEKNVLKDISLNFKGGKMTALVGHSCRKSTLLKFNTVYLSSIKVILK